MSGAHFHLIVNHFPIVGLFLALLVLLAGFALKNKTIKQTALALFILATTMAIVSNVSGENAEEVIEEMEGISHHLIHEHEEKAETFLAFMFGLGALSILAFIGEFLKKSWTKWVYLILLVASITTTFFAQQTGTSGGEISHPELRQGANVENTMEGDID